MAFEQVILTRTTEDNRELRRLLEASRISCVEHPSVAFRWLPDSEKQISETLNSKKVDVCAFTSRRGVQGISKQLQEFIARETCIAAVGHATAKAVKELLGRDPDTVPAEQTGEALARAIIAKPDQPSVVLHLCGKRVNPVFAELLAAAGMRVIRIPIYENIEPEVLPPEIVKSSIVIVSSGTAVDRFLRNNDVRAKHLAFVAIGDVTGDYLIRKGASRVVISPEPTARALFNSIQSLISKSVIYRNKKDVSQEGDER